MYIIKLLQISGFKRKQLLLQVPLRSLLIFIIFVMLRGLRLCSGMPFEFLKCKTKTYSPLQLYAQISIWCNISKKNTVTEAISYAQEIHS
jgi:hypothetical protein